MKKDAYTLAEILITLGIIGIIAAVVAPSVNLARPDKNKAMYLRSYDALTKAALKAANSSSIYPTALERNGDIYNITHFPFLYTNAGPDKAFPYSGSGKLGAVLADLLGGKNITSNPTTTFTTKDGVQWTIANSSESWGANSVTWYNNVTIDVNGAAGSKAGSPDQFQFAITASGNVIPLDVYGQMYIDNRKILRRRKNDKDISKYSAHTIGSEAVIPFDDIPKMPKIKPDDDNNNGGDDGGDKVDPTPPPPPPPTPDEDSGTPEPTPDESSSGGSESNYGEGDGSGEDTSPRSCYVYDSVCCRDVYGMPCHDAEAAGLVKK